MSMLNNLKNSFNQRFDSIENKIGYLEGKVFGSSSKEVLLDVEDMNNIKLVTSKKNRDKLIFYENMMSLQKYKYFGISIYRNRDRSL